MEEVKTDLLKLSKIICKALFIESSNDERENLLKIAREMEIDERQLNNVLNLVKALTPFCYSITDSEYPQLRDNNLFFLQGFAEMKNDQLNFLSSIEFRNSIES